MDLRLGENKEGGSFVAMNTAMTTGSRSEDFWKENSGIHS